MKSPNKAAQDDATVPVVKVDRLGTYTRLSRVGWADGKLQVPGNTATEWEPVVASAVVSWTGGPPTGPFVCT